MQTKYQEFAHNFTHRTLFAVQAKAATEAGYDACSVPQTEKNMYYEM